MERRNLTDLTGRGPNDVPMNRPLRAPSGATGSGGRGGPGGYLGSDIGRGFMPANYQNLTQVPLTLDVGESEILILEPPDIRAFLQIRNAQSSLGMLAISFVGIPTDETLAFDILSPGQKAVFNSGGFVPQQRVYVKAFNGICYAVGAYSNFGRN